MKFIIERTNLLDNLNAVSKAVTGKSNLEVLKGVFIQVAKNQIIMLGSDMDLSIYARGTCDVIEPGSILLDSKMFIEIISKLPKGDITIEKTEDGLVTISCLKSHFSVVRMKEVDYPSFPKEANGTEISVSKELFRKMIGEVYFAVAKDDTRPILQGILYEVKDSILKLVALDGYRAALTSMKVDTKTDMSAVIDGTSLSNIAKLIGNSGGMRIYVHQNHVEFRLDNLIIYSRLLEGKYINYDALWPTESKIDLTIDRLQLLDAIQRNSLIAKCNDIANPIIKFKVQNDGMLDTLVISSKSSKGNGREEINVELQGIDKEIEITFNGKYLEEMLKNIYADKIVMKFTTNISPCVCKAADNDDAKCLVLPVRTMK